MKKILLLIVVSAIFYACNSNDDDGLFQVKEQQKADSTTQIANIDTIWVSSEAGTGKGYSTKSLTK